MKRVEDQVLNGELHLMLVRMRGTTEKGDREMCFVVTVGQVAGRRRTVPWNRSKNEEAHEAGSFFFTFSYTRTRYNRLSFRGEWKNDVGMKTTERLVFVTPSVWRFRPVVFFVVCWYSAIDTLNFLKNLYFIIIRI